MPDLPGWAWVGVAWLLASVCVALGVGRWFRYMHDEDQEWHG